MPDANITKKALAESLKALMAEKPFAKIGIGDICDRCSMNRRSFYYHFQDKYELVIWIYNTEFLDLVYQKEYKSAGEFLLDLCIYFYKNRSYYIDLFSVSGQNSFREYYADIITPLLKRTLETEFQEARHAAFFAEFYADAFIISQEKWLRNNTMQPDEYVDLLRFGIRSTSKWIIREMQDSLFEPEGQAASLAE